MALLRACGVLLLLDVHVFEVLLLFGCGFPGFISTGLRAFACLTFSARAEHVISLCTEVFAVFVRHAAQDSPLASTVPPPPNPEPTSDYEETFIRNVTLPVPNPMSLCKSHVPGAASTEPNLGSA